MQGFIYRIVFIIMASILFAVTLSAQQMMLSQVTTHLTDQPLAFTKNMGQWPDSILFRANANGAVMWFTKDGVYQQFFKRIPKQDSSLALVPHPAGGFTPYRGIPDKFGRDRDSIETMMIKTTFVASNTDVTIETGDMLEYKCNYFLGNDSTKWATDVPNYSSITYKNIYSDIDLRYYGNGKRMEYDFIVSPGADPLAIKLRYDNVESVSYADNGDLVVKTKWSDIIEQAPIVYSQYQNLSKPVDARFSITENNTFAFAIDDYDQTTSLILDPVLVYSTYLGGFGNEYGRDIAVDQSGNAYVTGETILSNFPTVNAYDSIGGSTVLFITKLSTLGNTLVYSTYLGGGSDAGYGIAIDGSGNTYVTGYTSSPSFPVQNAFDNTFNGGGYDAFVTKLSSTGNSLIYSTYLGGSSDDRSYNIAVDGSGNTYITGYTYSSDFSTLNAYDDSKSLGSDVFVTKFAIAGNSLIYSTYLGGNSADFGYDIAVDGLGNTYITGGTISSDFPTQSAYDNTVGGGFVADVFVTKLSITGNSLIYSTYLGGNTDEYGYGIAVDGSENAYVTGRTASADFPTVNSYDSIFSGGSNYDAFITKFSTTGNNLAYSTYLGGSDNDIANAITTDGLGNVYVTGMTNSSDFPIQNAYDSSFNISYDAFIAKLSVNGSSLLYSTYFGGSNNENDFGDPKPSGIAIDQNKNVFITGCTKSDANFPCQNAFDSTANGLYDAFVTKFTEGCCVGIRGNVDNNGGVNVLDLNYLVAYFFSGGTAPVCLDEANVNGSGPINVLDLNYLVAYFFSGGPAPVACP